MRARVPDTEIVTEVRSGVKITNSATEEHSMHRAIIIPIEGFVPTDDNAGCAERVCSAAQSTLVFKWFEYSARGYFPVGTLFHRLHAI